MELKVPQALEAGHKSLCSDLEDIISSGGKIGEQVKNLSLKILNHFEKEEKYALPPLGLLLTLAEGDWEIDMKKAIFMTDKLQAELYELQKDHADILLFLENLKTIADEENNLKAKQFIKDLKLHIDIEDQILYPTTILIGNYLKK